jgi:hypothetical protein
MLDVMIVGLIFSGNASPARNTDPVLDSSVLTAVVRTIFALESILKIPAWLVVIMGRFASPPLTKPEVRLRVANTAAATLIFVHVPVQRFRPVII